MLITLCVLIFISLHTGIRKIWFNWSDTPCINTRLVIRCFTIHIFILFGYLANLTVWTCQWELLLVQWNALALNGRVAQVSNRFYGRGQGKSRYFAFRKNSFLHTLRSVPVLHSDWSGDEEYDEESDCKDKKSVSVSVHTKTERIIWISIHQVSLGSDLLLHVLKSQSEKLSLFRRHLFKLFWILFLLLEGMKHFSFLC